VPRRRGGRVARAGGRGARGPPGTRGGGARTGAEQGSSGALQRLEEADRWGSCKQCQF
jgi:hypothetical protein